MESSNVMFPNSMEKVFALPNILVTYSKGNMNVQYNMLKTFDLKNWIVDFFHSVGNKYFNTDNTIYWPSN